MSLSKSLSRLATAGEYPGGNNVKVRWGQLIRASSSLADEESRLIESHDLVYFGSLGRIRGGVVTRANAYFLVREIPFDQIPARLRVTRRDLRRIVVVSDGLDHVSKIEREFLKPVIKGPESLESAFGIKSTEIRLFDVKADKKQLEKQQANGALTYLRRGETIDFKTSEDDLKGGVPAQRSQVKNRKPFWYSLQGDQAPKTRIVFPEHLDRRYVFTLVPDDDESVIIDKLYLFEPNDEDDASLIHASLNTLFSWYQVELRGRSQLGEGVLELKIPDYAGMLLVNPEKLSKKQRTNLLQKFADLTNVGMGPSLEELGTPTRQAFDLAYLKAVGFHEPETMLLKLEHALRALAGERSERRLSVADAKVSRRKITNVAASIDAYAARLAASMEPHPDPRTFMGRNVDTETVSILAEVDGPLEIGLELFNQGEVLAGGNCVARAGSVLAAQFVKGVLLIQPELSQVDVPTQPTLQRAVSDWTAESRRWHRKFEVALEKALTGIDDSRTRAAIEQRALRLLHDI